MTEQEWLASTNPFKMLEFLRGKASERKLRLFAVTCCRRIVSILDCERIEEEAVILAEQAADGAGDSNRMLIVLGDVLETANLFPPAGKNFQGMNGVVMALRVHPEQPIFQMGFRCLANAAAGVLTLRRPSMWTIGHLHTIPNTARCEPWSGKAKHFYFETSSAIRSVRMKSIHAG